MGPWDDGNESNEIVENPFEDDVDVDEDALANDMTLDNVPTIVAPTPYALCQSLHKYEEDNSWRTWACDTTYTEEEELEKGMMFDSKENLVVVRFLHRSNHHQMSPYGSRWNFARRTRKHTGTGFGFYRD